MLCHRHRCRKLRERADINWALRKLPRQLRPHVLTVGSCCSGLGVEKLAIAYLYGELQQHVRHSFACDVDPASKHFFSRNHPEVERFYDDICAADFMEEAGEVNLFVAGFPCQPFSINGKNEGHADRRGQIVDYILQYLQAFPPDAFLLENVPGLMQRHGHCFEWLLKKLVSIKDSAGQKIFNVEWELLNSRDFGVPQNRSRLYIAGWRKTSRSVLPTPPLTIVFDEGRKYLKGGHLKLPPSGQRRLTDAYARISKRGVDPACTPLVIDLGIETHSGLAICPCLTSDRAATADQAATADRNSQAWWQENESWTEEPAVKIV